jgi:Putative peptidoglycan binding domain
VAVQQCSECGVSLGADGIWACDCSPRTAQEAVAAAFDSFRPSRVRPYFAPLDDPLDMGVPLSGTALGPSPETEDVGLFQEPLQPRDDLGFGYAPAPQDMDGSLPGDAPPLLDGGLDDGEPQGRAAFLRGAMARRPARAIGAVVAAALVGAGAISLSNGMLGSGDQDEGAGPGPKGSTQPDSTPGTANSAAPATPTTAPGGPASGSHGSGSDGSVAHAPGRRPGAGAATATSSPMVTGGSVKVPAAVVSAGSRGPGGGGTTGGGSTAQGAPVLRRGDSGPEVLELQKRLKESACLCYLLGTENGRYTSSVEDAVSRYQLLHRVTGDPDGVYGPNTRRVLEAETPRP